jgi:hypothetical protein
MTGKAGKITQREQLRVIKQVCETMEELSVRNQGLLNRLETAREKEVLLLDALVEAQDRVGHLEAMLIELADPANELQVDDLFLNPADTLPPVDCPLLIQIKPGVLVRANRPTFAASKSDQLLFDTEGGQIEGRFPWTYP